MPLESWQVCAAAVAGGADRQSSRFMRRGNSGMKKCKRFSPVECPVWGDAAAVVMLAMHRGVAANQDQNKLSAPGVAHLTGQRTKTPSPPRLGAQRGALSSLTSLHRQRQGGGGLGGELGFRETGSRGEAAVSSFHLVRMHSRPCQSTAGSDLTHHGRCKNGGLPGARQALQQQSQGRDGDAPGTTASGSAVTRNICRSAAWSALAPSITNTGMSANEDGSRRGVCREHAMCYCSNSEWRRKHATPNSTAAWPLLGACSLLFKQRAEG